VQEHNQSGGPDQRNPVMKNENRIRWDGNSEEQWQQVPINTNPSVANDSTAKLPDGLLPKKKAAARLDVSMLNFSAMEHSVCLAASHLHLFAREWERRAEDGHQSPLVTAGMVKLVDEVVSFLNETWLEAHEWGTAVAGGDQKRETLEVALRSVGHLSQAVNRAVLVLPMIAEELANFERDQKKNPDYAQGYYEMAEGSAILLRAQHKAASDQWFSATDSIIEARQ
jgi:hypothetical protein